MKRSKNSNNCQDFSMTFSIKNKNDLVIVEDIDIFVISLHFKVDFIMSKYLVKLVKNEVYQKI